MLIRQEYKIGWDKQLIMKNESLNIFIETKQTITNTKTSFNLHNLDE